MTRRSRLPYVLHMLCGLGIILTSLLGQLLSSADRSPLGHVVIPMVTGLYFVGLGGYGYLHPEKTNSSQAALLGAATGFLLVLITVVSLIHFYGITGFFSTGDSTISCGYAAFMLVVSVWLLFSSFSLRRKDPK